MKIIAAAVLLALVLIVAGAAYVRMSGLDARGTPAAWETRMARAVPIAMIVNELVTNSAKYAEGHITVRIEAPSPTDRLLSVIDDGPGLPAGFNPAHSKGLGMKIVLSLVQQIGGEFHILPGDNGRGTRFTVKF